MANQEWGRAERVIFPPRQPVYTYGMAMGAVIVMGFLLWIHFAALSPLQEAYTPAYLKSGFGAMMSRKNGTHELFMVGTASRAARPAQDADVVEGSTPSFGRKPIPLELSGDAKGSGLVTLYRSPPIRSTDAAFHAYLRRAVFQDQDFGAEYRVPLLWSVAIFLLALPFSIHADVKRRKEWKYGRKLRGPDKLTPAEFNRVMQGDGFGFEVEGMKELMRIPRRMEAQHILIMGDTGSGKTTLIFQLLRQIEERGETALIYDPAGEFTKAFFKKERGDHILNPLDARMEYWGPSEELRTKAEAKTLAKSLYQPTDKNKKEFFTEGPQQIFAKMLETGAGPHKLAEWMASEDEIDKICAGTHLAKLIPRDSPNQRNGTLGSLGLVADTFEMLPTLEEANGRRFVATEWAKERKGWIFITSRPTERDALRPIISLWLDWLILRLLSVPTPDQKPVYLVMDELASLQQLPQLHTALTESRKSKNPMILGFQGKDQMDEVYGPRVSSAMLSQPATKIFLRTSENSGSEWISKMIGKVEVERIKETHTGGTNAHKTYTLDRQIDPMVMESEVSGLEDKAAFLKLGNRVVQFNFPYLGPPNRAEAFIQRRETSDDLKTPPQGTASTPKEPVAIDLEARKSLPQPAKTISEPNKEEEEGDSVPASDSKQGGSNEDEPVPDDLSPSSPTIDED